jgi:hypothetical protein
MRLALLFFAALVQGKYYKSSLELSAEKPWAYLTKFGMDLGKSSWSVKAKLSKGDKYPNAAKKYPIKLQVYRDDYWAELGYTADCLEQTSLRFLTTEILLPADGSWISDVKGAIEERSSPHMWIFVLADCGHKLGEYAKIKLEFTVLNADDSHVSVEDQGLLSLHCILAVLFLAALGANIYQTYRRFVHNEVFDSHLLLLNVAISLQFFSLVLEIFNLSAYQSNGKGVSAFEFLGRSGDELAQLVLTILLIMVADGWTVTYTDLPSVEIYIAVFIFGGLAKFVLVAIGRLSDDSSDKFSDYESLSGLSLLMLRLVFFAWFLQNIAALFRKATGRVKRFVGNFTLTGSLFFLSQPVVVLGSLCFSPYLRNWIVVAGSVTIQMVSMLSLSLIFTNQRSEYNKIRVTPNSLPGNKAN